MLPFRVAALDVMTRAKTHLRSALRHIAPPISWPQPALLREFSPAFWAIVTLAFYGLARLLYAWRRRWWSSPLLLAWLACLLLAFALHASYSDYLRGTFWLLALLGPATVAFALPIYE